MSLRIDDRDPDGQPMEDLDTRAAKALTERMTVLGDTPPVRHDDALYEVITERTYRVDLRARACSCPDCLHRKTECKHQARVMYAIGRDPLPAWADLSQVDPKLGEHVAGEVRIRTPHGPKPLAEVRDR